MLTELLLRGKSHTLILAAIADQYTYHGLLGEVLHVEEHAYKVKLYRQVFTCIFIETKKPVIDWLLK
ncbi:hypothetical protein AMS58_11125 [Pseudoalteromonas porphyrae]|uniref:Uncharacterized protein n=1 Tax=Pseudoalteromonas porphyrae TaxID=187330 RepID=A0A0N1ELU7_9GAMM|nr:hypothetical protein ADS77_05335 [Pseudoalteromonas porphyrae]KPH94548.1 hypothetical protein AMS58_11125 [Pseudoalteromonas porphyrae]